jgi:hypothetical protein
LREKIRDRNPELMTDRLDRFWRKLLLSLDSVSEHIISKMPWDLFIRSELRKFGTEETEITYGREWFNRARPVQ